MGLAGWLGIALTPPSVSARRNRPDRHPRHRVTFGEIAAPNATLVTSHGRYQVTAADGTALFREFGGAVVYTPGGDAGRSTIRVGVIKV